MLDALTDWLDSAQRLCEAASPGPWAATHEAFNSPHSPFNVGLATCAGCGEEARCSCGWALSDDVDGFNHDMLFMARARGLLPAAVKAIRAVVSLHFQTTWCDTGVPNGCETCAADTPYCIECCQDWPCPTVRAITEALGVEG